jgi:hypothetical protein
LQSVEARRVGQPGGLGRALVSCCLRTRVGPSSCSQSGGAKAGAHPPSFAQASNHAVPGILSGAVGDTGGSALSATIRPHLTDNLVRTLVDHDDLQSLLKEDEPFQSLIGGVL